MTYTSAQVEAWFPEQIPLPNLGAGDPFEIGIVMAGAVSAGAYTAGVMSFLFEALDRWHAAKAGDPTVPQHKVVLKTIAGASAGGINGAITAVAGGYASTYGEELPAAGKGGNPFYDVWVNRIDILKFLDLADLNAGGALKSALNCRVLTDAAAQVVQWQGTAGAPAATRAWLADPLQLFLTLANVNGVPYKIAFRGNAGLAHDMVAHKDYVGFAVPSFAPVVAGSIAPDRAILPLHSAGGAPGTQPEWLALAQASLATGAFPVALEPRPISRLAEDYDCRFIFVDKDDATGVKTVVQSLAWPNNRPPPSPATFVSIDGGTFNNEPFDLAHTALAGRNGRNPRQGAQACRALLMVDPFTDTVPAPPQVAAAILPVLKRILAMFINQSRFKPLDIALAEAGDVYSRFLVAPSRPNYVGTKAIASGALGGFLGFFHRDYRRHDFLLGRANCQRFLRDWFVLPSNNPLFRGQAYAPAYCSKQPGAANNYQIIPLVGGLDADLPMPAWPQGALQGFPEFKKPITKRVDKLFDLLKGELTKNGGSGFFGKFWGAIKGFFAGIFLGVVMSQLKSIALGIAEKSINDAIKDVNSGRP